MEFQSNDLKYSVWSSTVTVLYVDTALIKTPQIH